MIDRPTGTGPDDTRRSWQTPGQPPLAPWPWPLDDFFWPTVIGVATVSGLIYLVCALGAEHGLGGRDGVLLATLLGAQVGGQLAIVGFWLAMGKTPLAARLLTTAATIGSFATPFLFLSSSAKVFLDAIFSLTLYVSVAALAGFVLTLAGARMVHRMPGGRRAAMADEAHRQFSLRQIFALTTSVAVLLGLARISGIRTFQIWPVLLAGALFLGISLSAAWAGLSDSLAAWVLALVVLPLIGIVATNLFIPDGVWEILIGTVLLLGVVLLTLLPFRLHGIRVRFRADRGESEQFARSLEIPQIVPEPVEPEDA